MRIAADRSLGGKLKQLQSVKQFSEFVQPIEQLAIIAVFRIVGFVRFDILPNIKSVERIESQPKFSLQCLKRIEFQ